MDNPMQTPGAFSWFELMTNDVPAAKRYYGELFGWTLEDMQVGPTPYTVIHVNGQPIGGMMACPDGADEPPTWNIYVTVSDIDQTVAKTTELGGKVLMGPMPIPTVGRIACLQDRAGAVLCVAQYDPGQG